MKFRSIAFRVVSAALVLCAGCFSRPQEARFDPKKVNTIDLVEDVGLEPGVDVVQLTNLSERTPLPPMSLTAPEYKIAPGDTIDITYHILYEREPQEYRIEIQDQLLIEVLYPSDSNLTRTVNVRTDGRVTLPLIGDQYVLGKSSEEVTAQILEAYKKYLKEPVISVSVERYNVKIEELKQAITTAPRGQSKLVLVRPDGRISLPLIEKELPAAGFTIDQIKHAIREEYSKIVRNIEVSVMLFEVAQPRFYVLGFVSTPGAYDLPAGGLTTAQAIAVAGSVVPEGDMGRIVLLKKEGYEQSVAYQVNLESILQSGLLERDIHVDANDVIFVPQRQPPRIYVAGEVLRPGAFLYEVDMDIYSAIALALGPLDTADLKSIVLIRQTGLVEPQAARIDLAKALNSGDLRYNLKLRPGDAIYVPKTYIARVDKWIDQWLSKGLYSLFPDDSSLDFAIDAQRVTESGIFSPDKNNTSSSGNN